MHIFADVFIYLKVNYMCILYVYYIVLYVCIVWKLNVKFIMAFLQSKSELEFSFGQFIVSCVKKFLQFFHVTAGRMTNDWETCWETSKWKYLFY